MFSPSVPLARATTLATCQVSRNKRMMRQRSLSDPNVCRGSAPVPNVCRGSPPNASRGSASGPKATRASIPAPNVTRALTSRPKQPGATALIPSEVSVLCTVNCILLLKIDHGTIWQSLHKFCENPLCFLINFLMLF